MDAIIQILSSVNVITLIAFVLTFIFIIIEFRFIVKGKAKKNTPQIPQFDPNLPTGFGIPTPPQKDLKQEVDEDRKLRIHKLILPILIVLMIIFGAITFMDLFFSQSGKSNGTVAVQEVKSSGIKIFTKDWKEIPGNSTEELKSGDIIYVAIGSVLGSGIDMARIKINETDWKDEHTTKLYDGKLNVYYRDYTIKPEDSALDIEAQLHSRNSGWLSD